MVNYLWLILFILKFITLTKGNGLVKTILHECGESFSAINATFVAIKGQPRPVDLSCVHLSSGVRMMSFLSLSTGLISDIDILSESMRWMGEVTCLSLLNLVFLDE